MGDISRRAMLGATGGLIAGGLLKTQADALTVGGEAAPLQTAQADPTKFLGAPTSVLGQRAPGEQPRRGMDRPAPTSSSRTPLEQLRGIITPADLHFERHHAGVPVIDPDRYGLLMGSGSVAEGKLVYDLKCVACHGPTGQEGPNDRLVGREPRDGFPFGETRGIRKTVGNYWPYATTLFDYVNRAMPMTFPGSLTANEIYAVAAYIFSLNEIIPEDAVMNAETLPAVVMPARDRFVPDNRVGGPEVR